MAETAAGGLDFHENIEDPSFEIAFAENMDWEDWEDDLETGSDFKLGATPNQHVPDVYKSADVVFAEPPPDAPTAPLWPPAHIFNEPLNAAAPALHVQSPASHQVPSVDRPSNERSNVLRDYVKSKQNKNTVKKTDQNVKRFREWLAMPPRFETRCLTDIPPGPMDQYVGGFLLDVKKPDNTEYEPDTLTSFHRSINRKLEESGYGFCLVKSNEFKLSKKVLESKRRELKQKGLGNRTNVASPLTVEDEEKLWETSQFGKHNPQSLLNTVWYYNAKLFGFRGQHESRQLQWADIALKLGQNGDEYLEFNERETKTRTGNSAHLRPFAPKIFATPEQPDRCPISMYKEFMRHRPAAMLNHDSPFYLGIVQDPQNDVWYRSQPMGHDKLSSIVKSMTAKAGLIGKFTNHSIRKTMITQLLHSGVNPNTVIQLSGHKSLQSLQNYHTASYNQQKAMSKILSGNGNRAVLGPTPENIQGNTHARPITSGPAVKSQRVKEMTPAAETKMSVTGSGSEAPGGEFSMNVSKTENAMTGLFAGAIFNGTVNIMFK